MFEKRRPAGVQPACGNAGISYVLSAARCRVSRVRGFQWVSLSGMLCFSAVTGSAQVSCRLLFLEICVSLTRCSLTPLCILPHSLYFRWFTRWFTATLLFDTSFCRRSISASPWFPLCLFVFACIHLNRSRFENGSLS